MMTRTLVALFSAVTLAACAHPAPALAPAVPAATPAQAPVAAPIPAPVAPALPVVDPAHVRWFGSWNDNSPDTAAFTNLITLAIGCSDDAAYANALAVLARDSRSIVWTANLFTYGPTARSRGGYSLRPDASDCWHELKALIANHLDRTVAIWLLDEPDDVAYGDRGATYDPNLYNDIIVTACAMIHADFPALTVALNYGWVPDGLIVPSCLGVVGLEAYEANWRDRLGVLATLTPAPVWLISPAFTDAPVAGVNDDATLAQRFSDQYDYARTHASVVALYPFLWCCDDTTTGDRQFYTVSGPNLPLTRNAFQRIGAAVVNR
jgi:hypothetical protein